MSWKKPRLSAHYPRGEYHPTALLPTRHIPPLCPVSAILFLTLTAPESKVGGAVFTPTLFTAITETRKLLQKRKQKHCCNTLTGYLLLLSPDDVPLL